MNRSKPVRFRFGPFEADVSTGELFENGQKLAVQEKPFLLLAALLEGEGRVVTREQLSRRLWPDTHVQVNQGLNAAVRKIRVALHDEADEPRFIETLGSRGYRFIHPFQEVRWSDEHNGGLGDSIRVAVLPLENISDLDDSIIEGLTAELISQLGRLHSSFRVIAPDSVRGYKSTLKSIQQVGSELHADFVLSGSVRLVKERVRLTAMLFQVADQSCLWAETYDRDSDQVFAIQDEVANHVAQTLNRKLLGSAPAEAHATRTSFAVYEAYLRGRYFWNRRTPAALNKSIEQFKSAIEQDPGYALAHAGLADAYIMVGVHGMTLPKDAFAKALAAAQCALALEPQLPEGLVALGWVRLSLNYDFAGAVEALERALRLNPSYAFGHNLHSYVLLAEGEPDAAIHAMARAQQLDPLSLPINALLGNAYFYARRYDEAISYGLKALDLDPQFPVGHACLGLAYQAIGRHAECVHEMEEAVVHSGRAPIMVSHLAHAHAVAGDRHKAKMLIDELLVNEMSVPSYQIGLAHLAMGAPGDALLWIQRAREERSHWTMFLASDPRVDALRSNPAFSVLLPTPTR